MQIPLDELKRPPRVSFANNCSVRDFGYAFEFAFWHTAAEKESLLRWLHPIDWLVGQVWKSSREFHAKVTNEVSGVKIEMPTIADVPPDSGAEAPRWANVISLARAWMDCEIAVYDVAPRAIFVAANKKAKIRLSDIEPVFSVRLGLPLLLAYLNRIERLTPELRARLGPLAPTD